MEVRKECDSDTTYHVGRMINGLSHQLKRQMCTLEEESGLTNMQSLVLHFIAFQTMERDLYQKDVEKAFQIRRSTGHGNPAVPGERGIHLPGSGGERCPA